MKINDVAEKVQEMENKTAEANKLSDDIDSLDKEIDAEVKGFSKMVNDPMDPIQRVLTNHRIDGITSITKVNTILTLMVEIWNEDVKIDGFSDPNDLRHYLNYRMAEMIKQFGPEW